MIGSPSITMPALTNKRLLSRGLGVPQFGRESFESFHIAGIGISVCRIPLLLPAVKGQPLGKSAIGNVPRH